VRKSFSSWAKAADGRVLPVGEIGERHLRTAAAKASPVAEARHSHAHKVSWPAADVAEQNEGWKLTSCEVAGVGRKK
jgi:hypothetical protein